MLILENKWKLKLLNFCLRFSKLNLRSRIHIGKSSKIRAKTFMDRGTRINGRIFTRGSGVVKIGKYCAFGDEVRILTTNHDANYANNQYALQREICGTILISPKKDVVIGNNVWIGDSVIILPGVHIGDGAIIGAGSVVTKSVPPFEIYAGNPAKFIRKRFSDEVIHFLLKQKWWEWPFEKMVKHAYFFKQNLSTIDQEILSKIIEASSKEVR